MNVERQESMAFSPSDKKKPRNKKYHPETSSSLHPCSLLKKQMLGTNMVQTARSPKSKFTTTTKVKPSSVPKAGPSSQPDAGPIQGPSREQEIVDFLNANRNTLTVRMEIEDDEDSTEMEVHSTATNEKDTTVTATPAKDFLLIDDIIHNIDSDDDLCLSETKLDCLQKCKASAEPASMFDYTPFDRKHLYVEDAINDNALRSIAVEKSYDFIWTAEKTVFEGRQENFTGSAGPTFLLTENTSILDVFYKMIDVDFIDMICAETNRYVVQKRASLDTPTKLASFSYLRQWKPTNRDEIITFLAVFILQGLIPLSDEENYFKYNGYATMPYFRNIIPYNRFSLLKTMIKFVNSELTDKKSTLWKIEPVIDYFNKKFSSLYYPAREVVVDESHLKWQGRLSISQKISFKAAQVGVKTYELCESSSGYLWKFIVYAGKKPTRDNAEEASEDNATASDKPVAVNTNEHSTHVTSLVVYKLVEPLLHRGHTLIMDNFYNSPLLARCLKRQKTDCYGTLRLSREFVPKNLKTLTQTDLSQGEVVASYCSDLSVMVWRDGHLVSMISTYHDFFVETANRDKKLTYKPNIVLEYNRSMGGVNRKEEFLSVHPMQRSRYRVWYKDLFRRLYDAAIFNCFVIFTTKNPKITHRRFRTLLVENLIKAHRRIDLTSLTIPKMQREYNKTSNKRCYVKDDHFPMKTYATNSRCWECAQRNVHTPTDWKCIHCQVSLCIDKCFRAYHKK